MRAEWAISRRFSAGPSARAKATYRKKGTPVKRFVFNVAVASALLLATALPVSANTDRNPNVRLDALEAAVANLSNQNGSQLAQIAKLQDDLATANAKVAALQSALAVVQSNPVLAIGPYVSLRKDTLNLVKGPHIVFEGVNVHIRDGGGERDMNELGVDITGRPSGLGNLIIGYNELSVADAPTVRGGSHCLVVGPGHSYTSNWGFVAGDDNKITAMLASVLGGGHHVAAGPASTIAGGCGNQIASTAWHTTVSGGGFNIVTGPNAWAATISGGGWNTVNSGCGTVAGGWQNAVGDGFAGAISAGAQNSVTGFASSVSGGAMNTATGSSAAVSGGSRNTAAATNSAVSGGSNRSATLDSSWVAGSLTESN